MRWKAVVLYRTIAGPVSVEYSFEELEELHDIIERGPDWNAVMAITVVLARGTGQTTVEAAALR